MCGLRHVQIWLPITFKQIQHLVNLIIDITAMGFGKSHNNFGVLLSMHGWVMTVRGLGCGISNNMVLKLPALKYL